MRRRTAILLGLLSVVSLLWLLLYLQPSYDGRPLGYWLDQLQNGNPREERQEAIKAISHIMTNSPMSLVNLLRVRDSTLKISDCFLSRSLTRGNAGLAMCSRR